MKSLDEILKSSGLSGAIAKGNGGSTPATALEAAPEDDAICARCGGAGFVRRAVRLGHPDFGKAFPCDCTQDESEDARQARLRRYSNIGPLSRLTFDNLSPLGRSANSAHQKAFSAAVDAARRFAAEPEGWLVLSGPSGCGKTHLAVAIAGSCVNSGQAALFMVTPDLLDHLRAAYQPGADVAYDELFELVRTAPVLLLDDLGVQSSTHWADEKLFQLINHRYNAQLPTVFTTNLDPAEFDPRIQSRLCDGTLSQTHYLESGPRVGVSDLDALELPHLRSMTFKSFDPRLCSANASELKEIENAYREAMKYAQDPSNWFAIAGPSGKGKTRLAAAIGNYCRETTDRVLFVTVPDLLDRLRAGYHPQSSSQFDKVFDEVKTVSLLILDDLGAESGTPWADEKMFQLINYRYNARLPTVFTMSVGFHDIPSRVATRLTDISVTNLFLIGDAAGDFDFFRKAGPAGTPASPRARGRPPRRS